MHIRSNDLNQALQNSKVEVMNFLNEVAMRYPQAISFAPGRPLEELFDVAVSLGYIEDYVRHEQRERAVDPARVYAALGQYGRTNGMIGELIARLLRNDDGITVDKDDIVVTVGAQEAMCMCLIVLCGTPGDVALVADPAYIGLSGAARLLGIDMAAVPTDAAGVDPEQLAGIVRNVRAAGKTPRMLYLSPEFANPTGVSMPLERRERLLAVTRELGLLVVEDHAYNYFSYGDGQLGPLKSMAGAEHVLYLGSFSKSIFPGVRLGFIAAGQRVGRPTGEVSLAHEFSKVKSLLTVNTSPLNQALVGGLLLRHDCSLKSYVEPRRAVLKDNRDRMLAALTRHFPRSEAWSRDVTWNEPAGGFFLTVRLPFTVTDADLTVSAERYGVLWTPMSYFFLEKESADEIRLSFSYVTPEQIERGIAALAALVRERRD